VLRCARPPRSQEKLIKKLQASDTKAEHLSWDRHTGEWKFKVEHF
jgi:hypothetical protein